MSDRLKGKIAVITGGASGIGLATAKRFVSEGAYAFIIDHNEKELAQAVSNIGKNFCRGIQCDVSKLKDLDMAYELIESQKGHVDILFANAGVIQFAPLEKITEEHFDKLFNINVKGLLFRG